MLTALRPLFFLVAAKDCILDPWGEWTQCDVECGRGTQTRERRIRQNKQFGGLDCEARFQKRFCRGTNCARRREDQGALETTGEFSITS